MSIKNLIFFDFDDTIINANSDIVVRDLLSGHETVNQTIPKDGWTDYMQNIFNLLHRNNIDQETITNTVIKIPPTEGMIELIKSLTQNYNFDVVIISDSNSYFIQKWLEKHQITNFVKQVFTNPAQFVDHKLNIKMYHVQDWCPLSSINLCKGQILDDFVKDQKNIGLIYNMIAYVGDGQNDFCPMLRLNTNDLACCRYGYKCATIVKDVMQGKAFNAQLYNIKANVINWKTGFDILKVMKNLITKI